MPKNKEIKIVMSPINDYELVLNWQNMVWNSLVNGQGSQMLWLGQHPSTITCGRRTQEENILVSENELVSKNIKLQRIDRGGDVTWHGPGQLVGYPLINLNNFRPDLNWYLRQIETVLMKTLVHWGIEAYTLEEKRAGVWVKVNGEDCKIASLGIHASRWVTKHGFALNVAPDLMSFSLINPCGLSCRMTSMKEILGENCPSVDEVRREVAQQFKKVFECEFIEGGEHVTQP